MALRNTDTDWGWLAKALHWLVALGIFWLLWLGWSQSDLPRGDERAAIRFTHASWAMLVLILMTIRLAWRAVNPTPAHPDGMPGWQRATASIVHWGLYLVIFTQLVAGVMTWATNGNPLPFFDLFSIQLPVAADREAHVFWEEIHEFLWKPLAGLIVLHFVAALYNHFGRKNDVLRRMTVGSGA